MYYLPSTATALPVNQGTGDRQHLQNQTQHQQQRFASSYSYNAQTAVTPATQASCDQSKYANESFVKSVFF